MLEIIRDQAWQFAGALFGLIAVIVSLVIFVRTKQNKALCYDVLASTPLLTMREELTGDIQILYKGTEVRDLHIIVIKVINTGTVPIRPTDFVKPLTFSAGSSTSILSAEITETGPVDIEANVIVEDATLTLVPLLLNRYDFVTIKLLTDRPSSQLKVRGRVVGVKKIEKLKRIRWGRNRSPLAYSKESTQAAIELPGPQ
jgi:hypothetical protein